jgi:transposase
MCNGLVSLSGIVRNHLKKDPISGDVFIFLNKTDTHIKLLYWDGDGFALFYKRLERGRYPFTYQNELSIQIKREELLMLFEGLSFRKMSRKKQYKFG